MLWWSRPMSLPSLVKLGPRTLRKLSVVPHPENCRRKRAKSSITQRWIIPFRSNFVLQSLNVWNSKCCKSSMSKFQRSRSQCDISYQHKNAIIQARISCRRSNFVKITSEPSATLKTCAMSLSHWNRNNFAVDCSIAFKCGTEFHHVTVDTLQMSKVKGQRSRSQRKVMYQQKRYNTAISIGSASSNLAWLRNYHVKGLEWLGRTQVAMHSPLPRFLVRNKNIWFQPHSVVIWSTEYRVVGHTCIEVRLHVYRCVWLRTKPYFPVYCYSVETTQSVSVRPICTCGIYTHRTRQHWQATAEALLTCNPS